MVFLAGCGSALLYPDRAVFLLSVFKSEDETVVEGGGVWGKALRALSSHQKSSDPNDLDRSGSAVFTLLGLASTALFSEIAQLLFCSL